MAALDERYMEQALALAERGRLDASPNPVVGCVIVRDGVVVGEGWHERAGAPHAEVNALRAAGMRARGAEVFVTLEPCSHTGRTPPCANALIKAGVRRVVAAMQDPNPRVAGSGLQRLREAGIDVSSGLLEERAEALNPGFCRRMRTGRPWVRLKLAASLDGRTALADGSSKWLTGELARADVHRWRARSDAIITGSGTVLADDPELTARLPDQTRYPLRVVIDSQRRSDPAARVFRGHGEALLAGVTPPSEAFGRKIRQIRLESAPGGVDLAALMDELGRLECNEVWVEAGARLAGGFLGAGLIDELLIYLGPSLLGMQARALMELPSPTTMAQRMEFTLLDVVPFGDDVRLRYCPVGSG